MHMGAHTWKKWKSIQTKETSKYFCHLATANKIFCVDLDVLFTLKTKNKKTLELWVFKIHKKKAKGLVSKCTKKKNFSPTQHSRCYTACSHFDSCLWLRVFQPVSHPSKNEI